MGLWEAFKCQNKCYLTRAGQFSRAQAAGLQSGLFRALATTAGAANLWQQRGGGGVMGMERWVTQGCAGEMLFVSGYALWSLL